MDSWLFPVGVFNCVPASRFRPQKRINARDWILVGSIDVKARRLLSSTAHVILTLDKKTKLVSTGTL